MALGNTTVDLFFHACLVALPRSGLHERTTVCILLLCAGPIEGCSAVLAVRRYCGFRSLVCAFVVRTEEEKQVQKQKPWSVCSSEAMRLAELMKQLALKKSTSPAAIFTSRLVVPSAMNWTEKSACVANLPRSHKHAHTNTRARFLLLMLWCCCCIAVGCGAATTAT